MQSEQCLLCIHYLGAAACNAFPGKIPDEIITGEKDHRKPIEGDHGIQFEPTEKKTAQTV